MGAMHYNTTHAKPQAPAAKAREPSGDHAATIATLLRDAGLAHWRALGAEFAAMDPASVSFAIATYKANMPRLNGPGALVAFLRTGAWPRDDLISPDDTTHHHNTPRPGMVDLQTISLKTAALCALFLLFAAGFWVLAAWKVVDLVLGR